MATPEEQNLADFQSTNKRVLDVWHGLFGDNQTALLSRIGAVILNVPIKRQIDGKNTNLATELAWLPTNFANVVSLLGQIGKDVAEVRELLKAIASAQSVKYDPAAIAKATAAELTGMIDTLEQVRTSVTLKELPLPEVAPLEDLGEVK